MKVELKQMLQKPPNILLKHILLAAVSVIILATACSQDSGFYVRDLGNTKDQLKAQPKASPSPDDSTLNNQSESLADQGEELLQNLKTLQFSDAYGKFNEAVQLNPKNYRAVFWTAVLKPVLETKGIVKRVVPLYKNPLYSNHYETIEKQLYKQNPTPFDTFFKDGPEDIQTPEELQEWMDRFKASIIESRELIRSIKNSEISIHLPEFLSFYPMGLKQDHCAEINFGPIVFDGIDQNCRNHKGTLVGLNRADFEAYLAYLAAYEFYLEILTAYKINPAALPILSGPQQIKNKADVQAFLDKLFELKNGGKLRNEHPLDNIKAISSDLVIGLKFLLENQASICPLGSTAFGNRPGYLNYFGYCIDVRDKTKPQLPEAVRTLQAFEGFLAGEPSKIFFGQVLPVKLNGMKLIQEPISDLKAIAPFIFDSCGRLQFANNQFIAPYLVSSNANESAFNYSLADQADQTCTTEVAK